MTTIDATARQASRTGAAAVLVRGAELVASPWKNGGGVTREIAVFPAQAGFDTFLWRVSVADVDAPGPFSRFAGIDRTLVLLAGGGMRLAVEHGMSLSLDAPLAVARFAGETAIDAELIDGPTRDFNLMVRRGKAYGSLEIWRGAGSHSLDADAVLIMCAEGTLEVALAGEAPRTLAATDTLRVDAAQALACEVTGEGAALVVHIHYIV
jgi:environmental stress-induced protein Ves